MPLPSRILTFLSSFPVSALHFSLTFHSQMCQYRVGNTYMRSRMQMENTKGREGIEVIASEPFKDDVLGEGHFSHVVYHFQSRAPAWIRALAPVEALRLEEKNWNAFPRCRTEISCPYFSNYKITTDSFHVADRGESENALKLSDAELELRKVDHVDIASADRDMWSRTIARKRTDPSKIALLKLNRGPLAPGWQAQRALYLEAHRKCYGWADDWCSLTVADARRIEQENIDKMRKSLSLSDRFDEEAFSESTEDAEEVEEEEEEEGMFNSVAALPAVASYHVGHTYMRSRMQMENTKGREGVEVIASEPFKDDVLGEGHFSHVVHHFQGRAPAWIRALAPLKALRLEEKNWNAYPRSRMELSCPYFTNFKIVVDTYHLADRGDTENALNLPKADLALRKVDHVDIASADRDMWSRIIARKRTDPSKIALLKLNRGPLAPGWQAHRALYLEAYRKCYAWADEWCEMTVADARRIEQENIDRMRKSLSLSDGLDEEAFSDAVEDAVEGEEEREEEGVFKSVTALPAVAPVAA
ncbi:unnamed protein product [Closterium sp. Naga37s-1]|nr:unnamed protein product [Closterium sp. Naga37s-1]